ncbi:MAG: undecaprenyl-diphosphate phosphatase [Flavobacteriales bacterium]|nr:undecaprenyl-diphosphate phosphatase [Flavobacteriales bacterium]
MSLIEAIIIGIVQGLTEFLPVSSSGHIELAKAVLNAQIDDDLLFTVFLHAATALSTIVVFRQDILQIFRGILSFKWDEETRFAWFVVLSMIPAAIVGLKWKDEIETFFNGNILFVSIMLLVTGLILFISDKIKINKNEEISGTKALIMGIVQAIAILPGISRSGSTIVTGVFLGMNRSKAARFSFLMVLPLILGVAAKSLLDYFEQSEASQQTIPLFELSMGFVAAFITGLFAIKWMIKLVEKSQLTWFALYCFIIGIVGIFFSF